jgi:hypothetical protein
LGLGLAVVLLGIVGGVAFLATGGFGGGSGGCGSALVRLSDESLTRDAFVQANRGISQTISELERGAVEDAESAFFLDVHVFIHTLDPEIRPQNEELAKELCESLMFLEEEFAQRFGHDTFGMSFRAQRIRSLFAEAQTELGF